MNDAMFCLGVFVAALGVLFVVGWVAITLARLLVNLALFYFPPTHEKGLEDDSGRFLVIPLSLVKGRIGKQALSTLTYQIRKSGTYERKPTINFRGPKGAFIKKTKSSHVR